MSGFGRTSAPVAICGVLGLLEALDSYKFDYNLLAKLRSLISLKRRVHKSDLSRPQNVVAHSGIEPDASAL
jgi:hypothetical protein